MPAQTHRGRRAAQSSVRDRTIDALVCSLRSGYLRSLLGYALPDGLLSGLGAAHIRDGIEAAGLRIVATRVPKPRKGEP